jgi:hypothetical protein
MKFNLRQYRFSQQRGRYPSGLLPDEDERIFRARDNPYRLHEKPGDGQGYKLTTPGSEGMLGDAPDAGVGFGGDNERKGYPKGISMNEDQDRDLPDLPKDTDPDDPFHERREPSQYGGGQGTDYGQALHDDGNVNTGDSVLGIHQTVMNDLNDGGRDRKTDIATMQGTPENKLKSRMPYNHGLRNKSPMDFVRNTQHKQSR